MRSGSHGLSLGSRRSPQKLRSMLPLPAGATCAVFASADAKVKALLSVCVVITVLLIAARAGSPVSVLMNFHHYQHPMPFLHPASASAAWKGYTIVINTWKRNEFVQKSALHYSKCAGVDSIHIVWSEPDPPPDLLYNDLRKAVRSNIDLSFDLNHEDSLNNRFKEINDLKSDAIFSIDDDVLFPCKSVEFAFNVWKSAPATMVGFVPRMHWLDASNCSSEQYLYGGWLSIWWTGTYSMVLTKAAFFHKKYLHLYSSKMPQPIRDYVTKNRNCEDIAMAFLVANETGAPPIWVKGKIFEMGSSGISSLDRHEERRTKCLNEFASINGYMSLLPTNVKAIDSRSSWFW